MMCRIADFCIEIEARYPYLKGLCESYKVSSALQPELRIKTTDADIDRERRAAIAAGEVVGGIDAYEQLSVYRKICAYALAHDAFLMHCAVIEYEGRGYAFSAPSGTGKTTHIRLWQKAFGEDKVTIVNGDKPILRAIDGEIYAYGTPWSGKEHYNTNTRVPLRGLCFLKRGEGNSIRRMTEEEAIPHLFSQVMIGDSTDLARQMELLNELLQKVPCYLLTCNMDLEAACVAYKGMSCDNNGGNDA